MIQNLRLRWLFRALVLAVLCSACSTGPQLRKPMQSWAYASWWMPLTEQGIQDSKFDRLVFFEIEVGSDGNIANANGWPERQTNLRHLSRRYDLPLDLTLSLKSNDVFESIFSNPEAVDRLYAACEKLLSDGEVSGLHLDFEFYDPASPNSLASLRQFVIRLGELIHKDNSPRILSIFVPTGGPRIYDEAGLDSADWVVMQSYDAHWLTSPLAGPIAPINGPEEVTWTKVAALAMDLGVPKDRVLMSYPLYGYEWPMSGPNAKGPVTGSGLITTLEPLSGNAGSSQIASVSDRVRSHGCTLDAESGSAFYQLPAADGWITGWYEGMNSLRIKTDFVRKENLGGMAFFVAGYDKYLLTSAFQRSRATGKPVPHAQC